MTQFTVEEINLICCYKAATKEQTIEAINAALPFMEQEIRELADRAKDKLHELTEEAFAEFDFTPAEDTE